MACLWNQPNRGRDIVSVKNALSWLGPYPADKARRADPTPDDDPPWGLQDFQRAFGLARDGFSLPGGETERKLDDLVQPMIQLAIAGESVSRDQAQQSTAPVQVSRQERRDVILSDMPATFPISENPDAGSDEAWFEWPAMSAVGDYEADAPLLSARKTARRT